MFPNSTEKSFSSANYCAKFVLLECGCWREKEEIEADEECLKTMEDLGRTWLG